MQQRRNKVALVAVAAWLTVGGVAACSGQDNGGGGSPGRGPAATSDLGAVAGSGTKVLDAKTFRYSVERRGPQQNDMAAPCSTSSWQASIDAGRQLAFVELERGGTDVIVSPESLDVRSSSLAGWNVAKPWLRVPSDDAKARSEIAPVLGVDLGASFWTRGAGTNPIPVLRALAETATGATMAGHDEVRGEPTTRYDLTVDPARAAAWAGGTTTSTAPADPRTRREAVVELLEEAGPPIPDDVKQRILDGDVEPYVRWSEQTTGTMAKPSDRALVEAMVSGDPEKMIRDAEASTGTTIDPIGRQLLGSLVGPNVGTPDQVLPGLFNSLAKVTASAWVAGDGTVRRIDLRVVLDVPTTATTSSPMEPLVDVRFELWDVGRPVDEARPPAGDVLAFSDLPPGAVPPQPTPCPRSNPSAPPTTR